MRFAIEQAEDTDEPTKDGNRWGRAGSTPKISSYPGSPEPGAKEVLKFGLKNLSLTVFQHETLANPDLWEPAVPGGPGSTKV